MAEPFVLDRAENPHEDLLQLALAARRRSRVLGSSNLAAQSYYIGILHACAAATGCEESEIVGWLDFHDDRPVPAGVPHVLSDKAIDCAVRHRRLALAGGHEPLVYMPWSGMLSLLVEILGVGPEVVDAFIAAADPDPHPAVLEQPVSIRPA